MTIPLVLIALPACAIRHYDADTNTVHWWGFGHFSARVAPPETGVQCAAVSGAVLGAQIQTGDDAGWSLGWNRWQRLWITQPDVAFELSGPMTDFIELNAAGISSGSEQPKTTEAPEQP